MVRLIKGFVAFAAALIVFYACGDTQSNTMSQRFTNMCEKLPMQPDGIVRLSKIKVNPAYLEEYMKYAIEVGAISLKTEPGVLTMYAVADKANPADITILETYASQGAYQNHINSEHFRNYKQRTLHMVDSLLLDDVSPLNPDNRLINYLRE